MEETTDYWTLGSGSFGINLHANSDDLLSDANEWFECAKALTDLLTESMQDGQFADRRRAIFVLTAIRTLVHMGSQCAVHAHERLTRCDL